MMVPAALLVLASALCHAGAVGATDQPTKQTVHTAINVAFDPPRHRMEASAQLRLSDIGPDEPVLELAGALEVEQVELDGKPVPFQVRTDGARQLLTVNHPQRLCEEHVLRVVYAGEIHDPPKVAGFTRGSIADQTEGTIQAEGVFLPPSSGWYPRVAGFDDPATYRVSVELPEGWDAVAEGSLEIHERSDGAVHVVYSSAAPVAGLHLVAGPWQRIEQDHQGIRVAAYLYPEDTDLAESYLPAVKRYLDLYSERLGPYPFGRFSVVENFFATGYGMPGFTVLGREVMRLPFIVSTSLGHEVAHSWWGNGVYVDEQRGNWCEGLTTYVAEHHYRELESAESAAEYRREVCRAYTNYVSQDFRDLPLSEFTRRSTPATRAIGYGKAMMVFHMLERRLGSRRFNRALREVYRDHLHRQVSWDTWREAFSRVAGEDLRWFFKQWVRRPGAPQLELAHVVAHEVRPGRRPLRGDDTPSTGDFEISGTLLQRGDSWRIRVPLVIEAGEQAFRRTVEAEGPAARFRLQVPVYPETLRVDPDQEVFRRLDPLEMPPVLSQVLGDAHALFIVDDGSGGARAKAYRALAETLTRTGEGRLAQASRLRPQDLSGRSVFLLGLPAKGPLRRLIEELPAEVELDGEGFSVEGNRFTQTGASLLVVGRHPEDPAHGVALFWGLSPKAIEQAGRKLIHYGKYSFLVFIDGSIQAKGVARLDGGPLIYRFSGNPGSSPGVQ